MTVLIGTSGFSYKDWVGPVYPEGLPKQEWLAFYSSEFPTCELNFSYYRIPDARTLDRMAAKVPEGFLFSIKAFQGITHERAEPEPHMEQFTAALAPLIDAEKFACVLAQFPHSFHANQTNRDYLKRVREGFGDLRSWSSSAPASGSTSARSTSCGRSTWAFAAWINRASRAWCRRWRSPPVPWRTSASTAATMINGGGTTRPGSATTIRIVTMSSWSGCPRSASWTKKPP
jgi:uncharacterized protein YecE (DUF72 family)